MEKELLIDFLLSKEISDSNKIKFLLFSLGLNFQQIAEHNGIKNRGSVHWSVLKAKQEMRRLVNHNCHIELIKVLFQEDFFDTGPFIEECPTAFPYDELEKDLEENPEKWGIILTSEKLVL